MQTFLPYKSFAKSARVLDNKRLGKQRIEAYQILNTLLGRSVGWSNHPAVKMWRGYEGSLYDYACAICDEWAARGFSNQKMSLNLVIVAKRYKCRLQFCEPPGWLGNKKFHASHRSNLLRKDPGHYGILGWRESNDMPYVWPCEEV